MKTVLTISGYTLLGWVIGCSSMWVVLHYHPYENCWSLPTVVIGFLGLVGCLWGIIGAIVDSQNK